MSDPTCLFCKIVAGEIPAEIVHRTDDVLAFRDINPTAPTHILVIPTEDGDLILTVDVQPDLWFMLPGGDVLDLSQFDWGVTGELLDFEFEFESEFEDGFAEIEIEIEIG